MVKFTSRVSPQYRALDEDMSEQINSTLTKKNGWHKLSLDSMVKATGNQVSCDLVGEAVILDLKSGVYYGLDSVAARIWALLQEPIAVGAVRDALLDEYEVEPERCEEDLFTFLEQMKAKQLVEITDESGE